MFEMFLLQSKIISDVGQAKLIKDTTSMNNLLNRVLKM